MYCRIEAITSDIHIVRPMFERVKKMDWLNFIVIGILVGWVAGLLTKGRGHGLLGNLAVGVIGAFAGGYLFDVMNMQIGGQFGPFIMSVIGAVVVLVLLRIIT